MSDTDTEIPVEWSALFAAIAATPVEQRWDLRKRFLAQAVDKDDADDLFDRAEEDVRRSENIDAARADLSTALARVEGDILATLAHLDELAIRFYDVEYAEGQAAGDMRAFLADAGRAVRAAIALNPATPKD